VAYLNGLTHCESTKNLSYSWRFQRNSSGPTCRWTFDKHWSKAFHLWPDKSLPNNTFGGIVSITVGIVSLLWRIMLYNTKYYLQREVLPSHLSSQNLIFEPSFMAKEPRQKKKINCYQQSCLKMQITWWQGITRQMSYMKDLGSEEEGVRWTRR
jgi:hypothetical protein